MNETLARVVRVEGETAWVRVEAPASCGACGGRGCGSTSVFGQLFNPRPAEYPVDNGLGARVGEAVVVGVPEGAVLRSVFRSYVLPLLLLLAGAVLGMQAGGEPLAMAGAGLGLALGLVLLRGARGGQPVIVRRGEGHEVSAQAGGCAAGAGPRCGGRKQGACHNEDAER